MARGPFATAAFVEKAFGLEGDVVVRRAAGVSFSALAQVRLHVVPPADPNDAPRVLHVAHIEGVNAAGAMGAADGETVRAAGEEPEPRTARVGFAEVGDVGVAKLLAGRRLLAAREEFACAGCAVGGAATGETTDAATCEVNGACDGATAASDARAGAGASCRGPRAVLGCTVRDERYGCLGEVVETIATPANEVWVVHGAFGEVLVPVVDECVESAVPDAAGVLFTHVIDGIVDARAGAECIAGGEAGGRSGGNGVAGQDDAAFGGACMDGKADGR
jgi:hypothetical protein